MRPAPEIDLEAFLLSTGIVALAEVGDKTQLLAFLLAARFRKSTPIVLGILVATLLNHGFAGTVGMWAGAALPAGALRVLLGISFLAMAVWVLVPDKLDDDDAKLLPLGIFGTTLIAFFLAEMGDKTQVATVALAARYAALPAVVGGTTLGMLTVNAPVVLLGERLGAVRRARWVHVLAAALFVALGIAALLGYDGALT